MFHPFGTPCGGLEWFSEVLCLVNHLAVSEFHDADGVDRAALVSDGVLRDPKIAGSQNPNDAKT